MLKRREEAKKLFEQVVTTRGWRGVELAGALFELGEIESEAGNKGTAHGYFQRVYVSQGAFPQYTIKAYVRAADMLRMEGKHDEAKKTLQELIRKHPDSPEAKKARTIAGE